MRINVSPNHMPAVLKAIADFYPDRKPELREIYAKAKHGVKIELGPVQTKRSTDQNARYYAIIQALAEYAGDTKAGMHEEVLCAYHGADVVVNKVTGMAKRVPRGRSSKLNTQEFTALMAIAEQWAAEAGVQWEEPMEKG